MFLTKEEKEWFQLLVQKIQTITKTSGRIVNGNLEKLSFGKAKEALGCNLNKGELIIIDNFDIMIAYRYKACCYELYDTICHEIAHNVYSYHCKGHRELTQKLIKIIMVVVS